MVRGKAPGSSMRSQTMRTVLVNLTRRESMPVSVAARQINAQTA